VQVPHERVVSFSSSADRHCSSTAKIEGYLRCKSSHHNFSNNWRQSPRAREAVICALMSRPLDAPTPRPAPDCNITRGELSEHGECTPCRPYCHAYIEDHTSKARAPSSSTFTLRGPTTRTFCLSSLTFCTTSLNIHYEDRVRPCLARCLRLCPTPSHPVA
jgi:hypothetical protein